MKPSDIPTTCKHNKSVIYINEHNEKQLYSGFRFQPTKKSMMNKCCGNCRQFLRSTGKPVDLCGAWGNPTTADRAACHFWMKLVKKKPDEEPTKIDY
ncbi:hypothetical protein L3V77_19235 [Vibrio sp. DW001]|uniref:hypothetical protein n=1 Tax=Vibrio sp. DW001 TaxID=2912315 RepID=UPI0023B00F64|nr:hypothetical protein [Vibrio sp. DW001]WED29976.1 hypothetical protein L3V77_19235 [Vibrio sp. DW001]